MANFTLTVFSLLTSLVGIAHAQVPARIDPVNDRVFSDVRIIRSALETARMDNAAFFGSGNHPTPLSYCVGFAGQLGALDQGRRMAQRFAAPVRGSEAVSTTPFHASMTALAQAYLEVSNVFSEYCTDGSEHYHDPAMVNRGLAHNVIDRLNRVYSEALSGLTFTPVSLGSLDAAFYNRFVVSLSDVRNLLQDSIGVTDRCLAIAKVVGATDTLLAALPPRHFSDYVPSSSYVLAFRAVYFGIFYSENDPLVARISGLLGISTVSTAPEGSGFLPWIPHSNCTRTAETYTEEDVDWAWNYIRTQLSSIESGRL